MKKGRRRRDPQVRALRREYRRSEQARRAAEAAHDAKVRFFAQVNHDLRQPLNALGLLAQTLQASGGGAHTREVADHMVACVDAMGQVVNELLGLARLDAGPLAPQPAAWRLGDVLHEVACTFEPLARVKGLSLAVQVAPQCRVCCDRALLSRVLGNLVSNAIHYTAEGGVRLVAHEQARTVALHVEDTGIGIAAQHLPHIFDEFYRVAAPGTQAPPLAEHASQGLGLATVRRLSRLMGLQVEVHSVVGQGSRFSITLPRPPAPVSQVPAGPAGTAVPEAPMGCRVLVIDDDADSGSALQRLLLAWGCEVRVVSARTLLQQGAETGWRPDVVVADMHLVPTGDGTGCGLAAVRAVRAAWRDAALPALLVTGDAGSARMREAQVRGYTVMTKPIKAAWLRIFLKQALAGRVERRLAWRVKAA